VQAWIALGWSTDHGTPHGYDITDEADLAEPTERLNEFHNREAAELSSGHNLGTIGVVGSKQVKSTSASS